ncbi:hypothetical protein WT12_08340 [Burkholderia territorii]|uniref:hypothetical protein n=1 Tax=Burkholderia territorii TaxID=1503055 RepID=UPI00076DD2E7|nr:hypothetical protein [Burkholderia territorii]KVN48745.1 hypothetical protein WT12_08340 [Burkholderia territorii]
MANVRDQIAAHYSADDAPWAAATGDLAHAIIERALSMPLAELRTFVAPVSNGAELAAADDRAMSTMVLMARNALL